MIPMIGWTWDECVDAIGELGALAGCEQQPDFHGEGDVATHTRMVLAALESDPAFAALEDQLRTECFLAALLHDVAKPACTRVEDGRITARGHARVGAIEARRILWQLGVEPVARERVCTLIHYHLHPFWALERTDADRHARAVSVRASCRQLEVLARADGCGRIAATSGDLVEAVGMYGQWCGELGIAEGAFPFGNDTARVEYFRREDRDPYWTPPEADDFTVTVMTGLPGAGKDTWVAAHRADQPVVSLDELRQTMNISPTAPQGPVVNEARERAKVLLRSGTDFTWNATNIAADHRGRVVSLCLDYGARVHIVAVEASPDQIAHRNRTRSAPVPPAAIAKMLRRWDAPNACEAHDVTFIDSESS